MVFEVRLNWIIPNAGPSVSTFHFEGAASSADAWVQALSIFTKELVDLIPDAVSITFPSEVTELDTASGQLVATYPVLPPAVTVGDSAATFAGGAGARIRWSTGVVRNGRRVVGSTFIVPMQAQAFGVSGTVTSGTRSQIDTAAAALLDDIDLTGDQMVVYSRPTSGRAGVTTQITAGATSSIAGTLRSRKQ